MEVYKLSINDGFKIVGFLSTLYGGYLLHPGVMFVLLGIFLILLSINFKEMFNIIVAVPVFGDSTNDIINNKDVLDSIKKSVNDITKDSPSNDSESEK